MQNVDLSNKGIVIIPSEHEGCSQKSVEKGEIIKARYQALQCCRLPRIISAVVVANPKLLEIPCATVEQMKLVNTFYWLDEYSNNKEGAA